MISYRYTYVYCIVLHIICSYYFLPRPWKYVISRIEALCCVVTLVNDRTYEGYGCRPRVLSCYYRASRQVCVSTKNTIQKIYYIIMLLYEYYNTTWYSSYCTHYTDAHGIPRYIHIVSNNIIHKYITCR